MAEEGIENEGGLQPNGEDAAPQVGIITQYVKDLSFENPNAPAVYQWQGQPNIDVQFNIGSQGVAEDVYEVVLKVMIKAINGSQTTFQVELEYGALFALRNVPEEQLQPFLLAEAPRLIFPYVRRIVGDAVRDGGFPPLMLEPMDFTALYLAQLEQQEAGMGQPQGQA